MAKWSEDSAWKAGLTAALLGMMHARPGAKKTQARLEPPGWNTFRSAVHGQLAPRFGNAKADAYVAQMLQAKALDPMSRDVYGVRGETLENLLRNMREGEYPGMKVAVVPDWSVSGAASGFHGRSGRADDAPGVRLLLRRDAVLPSAKTRTVGADRDMGSNSVPWLRSSHAGRTKEDKKWLTVQRERLYEDMDADGYPEQIPFNPADTSIRNAADYADRLAYWYIDPKSTFRRARAEQQPYMWAEQAGKLWESRLSPDARRHWMKKSLEDLYRQYALYDEDALRYDAARMQFTLDEGRRLGEQVGLRPSSDIELVYDPDQNGFGSRIKLLDRNTGRVQDDGYVFPANLDFEEPGAGFFGDRPLVRSRWLESPGGKYPKGLRDAILESSTDVAGKQSKWRFGWSPDANGLLDRYGETEILRYVPAEEAVKAVLIDDRLKGTPGFREAVDILGRRGIPVDTYGNVSEEAVLSHEMGDRFREDAKGGEAADDLGDFISELPPDDDLGDFIFESKL